MAIRPLSEEFQVAGHWFLPEEREKAIAGNLRYTPRDTTLDLSGAFRPLRAGAISAGDNWISYPTVYGITQQGEAVTLIGAKRIGISMHVGSGGMQQPERLITTVMLIGAHVPSEFAFPAISFRVPGLQIWHSRAAIHETFKRDETQRSSELNYRITRPATESVHVPAMGGSLDFELRLSWKTDKFTAANATISAWMTIRPNEPQDLTWYLSQLSKVTTMLTFLAGVPMAPDCIEASMKDDHLPVSVMLALRDDAKCCTYRSSLDFYLTREAMGIELDQVLTAWFEVYPRVQMPSRLAMSVLGSENLWLHVEFLSLMQALEGFHRNLYPGSYMESGAYEDVQRRLEHAIPGELSEDHRAALRTRLRYGNQISLRKRLDVLADFVPALLRPLIFGKAGQVLREWIDTRHYYTHWDESLRPAALDGQSMHYANIRLRHFLRVLYLRLMGIPEEALVKAANNASAISQYLIQILAVERRKDDPNDRTGTLMNITEGTTSDPET